MFNAVNLEYGCGTVLRVFATTQSESQRATTTRHPRVPICDADAFVLTAYLTDKPKRGEVLWRKP